MLWHYKIRDIKKEANHTSYTYSFAYTYLRPRLLQALLSWKWGNKLSGPSELVSEAHPGVEIPTGTDCRNLEREWLHPLRLPLQNTTDWVAYEHQKFTSHTSGGWEVQDQGDSRFGVWWGLALYSERVICSLCPYMANELRERCTVSFIRALIAFRRASPSWLKHLPKGPTSQQHPIVG